MTLEHSLTTLEASGLIRLAQMEPELDYLFRHALVQEATYESILKADRQILHRAVAETLEKMYPEHLNSLAFFLGQHWHEANERIRACQFFIQAGQTARKIYANREAIAAYTEALSLVTNDTLRFALLAERVAIYDQIAARNEQPADIDEMTIIAENLNDDELRCKSLLFLVDYLILTNPLLAPEIAMKVQEIARKIGDRHFEAYALYRQGLAHLTLQQFSQSLLVMEKAKVLYDKIGETKELADCYSCPGYFCHPCSQQQKKAAPST